MKLLRMISHSYSDDNWPPGLIVKARNSVRGKMGIIVANTGSEISILWDIGLRTYSATRNVINGSMIEKLL